MEQVAQLRAQGQNDMAQAVIELVRETLRRFDERVDIAQFLPPPKQGEQDDKGGPEITPQMVEQAKQMIAELQQKLAECQRALEDKAADREADVQKARLNAAADVEKAEVVAKIDAAAKIEVARITAAVPPLPAVLEPAGLVAGLNAVEGQDRAEDAA